LKVADEAVFISAAKSCASTGGFSSAIKLIKLMLSKDLSLNKFVLSFVLRICLEHYSVRYPNSGFQYDTSNFEDLVYFLSYAKVKSPNLITESVSHKVMKEIVEIGQFKFAYYIQFEYFRHLSCDPEILNSFFEQLQIQANQTEGLSINVLSEMGLNMIKLYSTEPYSIIFPSVEYEIQIGRNKLKTVHSTLIVQNRKYLLNTNIFNIVLRLLRDSNNFGGVLELFRIMSNSDIEKIPEQENELNRTSWKPNTFTLAELIRISRQFNSPRLAYASFLWTLQSNSTIFIPLGVINDCISFVYR
jgi:hypothetical protein